MVGPALLVTAPLAAPALAPHAVILALGAASLAVVICTFAYLAHRRCASRLDALRQTETSLRAQMDGSLAGAFLALDGKVLHANRRCAELLGRTQQDLLGQSLAEILPTFTEQVLRRIETELASGRTREARSDHTVWRPDGSAVRISTVSALPTPGGLPEMVGSLIDVTEQEAALSAVRELAHELQEAHRLGLTFPLNVHFRSLTWTTSAMGSELLGIALPNPRPLGDFLALVVPEDREQVQALIEGARVSGAGSVLEFRMVRPGGGAMRHLRLTPGAGSHQVARPEMWKGTLQDISEIRHAERQLRESSRQMTSIIDAAMDAIITVDDAMRIVVFNRAATRMFRLPGSSAIGKPIDKLVPARFREGHAAWMQAFARDGATSRAMADPAHLTVTRADGEQFSAEAAISHSTVEGRGFYTVILRDVTRERLARLEATALTATLEQRVGERTVELTNANNALELFAFSVAHDLRAPVRVMSGFAHLMQLDLEAGRIDDMQVHAARVITNAARMSQMIDGLLVVARASHGELAHTRVRQAEMVEDILSEQQARTHAKVRVGPLPDIDADQASMRQVWENLISNAIKYTARVKVAEIEIACAIGDESLAFSVADNGCGMEDIQRCVEAFQSSKDSGDEKTAGRYGLGLTLSMVHSQRLVPGTVFCCITSATRQASNFRRQHYLVDTTEDKMRCARDETVLKASAEVSGTCVSLLVPVSTPPCACH